LRSGALALSTGSVWQWKTVKKHFSRWCHAGTWALVFEMLMAEARDAGLSRPEHGSPSFADKDLRQQLFLAIYVG